MLNNLGLNFELDFGLSLNLKVIPIMLNLYLF